MTGHSIAEVIISPDKIEYTGIENPEYYLIISEEGAARVRNKIEALHATTTVVCNEIILPETKAEMGKLTIGTISVASLISHSGIFPTEAFKKAINFYQKPSIAETNIKAVDAGIGLCKSL
jgi:Pyruvate/2-oxoacid:ferredoxin oxidoreductase gamma subunit